VSVSVAGADKMSLNRFAISTPISIGFVPYRLLILKVPGRYGGICDLWA